MESKEGEHFSNLVTVDCSREEVAMLVQPLTSC